MAALAAVRGVVSAVARNVVGEAGDAFATLEIQGAYPAPTVGVEYSQALPIVGGSGTYSAPAFVGVAPDGLSLSVGGTDLVLSGTPTNGGPFDFNVSVFDATNGWRAFSAQAFTVIVPVASERIQNGNFDDGDNGWEVGADWAIIAGQAVGTTGLTELVNILSTPIDSFADISAFSALLINPAPDSVIIYLRSESRDDVIYFGAGDGVIGPDTAVAGSHGPYTHLVIVNNDGADPISIDNVTLVV